MGEFLGQYRNERIVHPGLYTLLIALAVLIVPTSSAGTQSPYHVE